MANELYPVELSALQSKNALHLAHRIKTASEAAEEGQALIKTEDGLAFMETGGKIDHILVNGVEQTVTNKTVDLEVTEAADFEQFQQNVQADQDAQDALITALKTENAQQNMEIQFLKEASEGVTLHIEESATTNYEKPIPAYTSGEAKLADIKKIGGKTEVKNQLVENGNFDSGTSNWTLNIATMSVSNNKATVLFTTRESRIISKIISWISGHKYFISLLAESDINSDLFFQEPASWTSKHFNITPNVRTQCKGILTTTATGSRGLYIGSTGNSTVIFEKIRVTDLTLRFGAGNEPTSVTDERILAIERELDEDPSFVGSELVSADVKQIVSRKADNTLIESLTIPQALRTDHPLKSAGTAHDEWNLATKKGNTNIGVYIVTGNENWQDRGTNAAGVTVYSISSPFAYKKEDNIKSISTIPFLGNVSGISTVISRADSIGYYLYYAATQTNRYIYAIGNIPTVGTKIYYELEDEDKTEYDISSYLDDFNPLLPVENGGSLTFVQDETYLQVPNTEDIYYILGGAT